MTSCAAEDLFFLGSTPSRFASDARIAPETLPRRFVPYSDPIPMTRASEVVPRKDPQKAILMSRSPRPMFIWRRYRGSRHTTPR
jgi:hypothetical protein